MDLSLSAEDAVGVVVVENIAFDEEAFVFLIYVMCDSNIFETFGGIMQGNTSKILL